jgi:hypothetical protein
MSMIDCMPAARCNRLGEASQSLLMLAEIKVSAVPAFVVSPADRYSSGARRVVERLPEVVLPLAQFAQQ